MICIFCFLTHKKLTDEHILADCIAGSLIIQICKECNDKLGRYIDPILVECDCIRLLRQKFKIKSRKREIPNVFRNMHEVDNPRQKVSLKYDYKTKKHFRYYHPLKYETTKGIVFSVSGADEHKLKPMIDTHLKRQKMAILDDLKFNQGLVYRMPNNPVKLTLQLASSEWIVLPLMKIAYEFTYLQLGEAYLNDPIRPLFSKRLYDYLTLQDDAPINVEYILFEPPVLPFEGNDDDHEIILFKDGNFLECAVKIFNVYGGVFRMSNSAENYNLTKPVITYIQKIPF